MTAAKIDDLIARAGDYKFDFRQPGAFDGVKLLSDLTKALTSLKAENESMAAHVRNLVEAKALSGVRTMVAGWNGENRPDGPYERHPSRLGARIETNCGRIYELDEALQAARSALTAEEG